MEFRLLGPVEVAADGRVVDVGPPQRRAVLAALLVDAGRSVSPQTLVDRVWDEAPPAGARRALHAHIARLRRLLAPVELVLRPGGYVLQVNPEQVDLHRFHQLTTAGADRVTALRAALDLWRGTPLADLSGPWAARTRASWQQERVDTITEWAALEIGLGRPEAVLGVLRDLAGEHPLSEPVAEVLIRALASAGRTTEALESYARTRARFREDLGADPGPRLRSLHQAILRGEPVSGMPTREVPAQLPADLATYTGRVTELASVLALLTAAGSTVVVSAIDGMAGIGKTTLAVHAAHQVRDRFPDGQLFIDLHGFTSGIEPIDPADALDRMLRALGVPGGRIPTDLDSRAALYRTRLADRRMLILLDNAATPAQVQPLLPAAPGCLVIVTSRRQLVGLDDAHPLTLDVLPPVEAAELFTRIAGQGHPADLVAGVVELCGRLPLAIRIAAARLTARSTWTLATLADRLRDSRHRLDELAAGDRSVAAAFSLSYAHLDAGQRRLFRLIGLHLGPDIDRHAAAALAGLPPEATDRLLEGLTDAHLLQQPTPGRYRFHDLLRAHAAHTAAEEEPEPERDAAVNRLLDFYARTASMAISRAYPYLTGVPQAESSTFDSVDQAATWLDNELPNLLAAAHGAPAHTLALSAILRHHLHIRARFADTHHLLTHAASLAAANGDHAAELDALRGLADAHRMCGRYEQAVDCLRRVLAIARTTGHHPGEIDALHGLGLIHRTQGRFEQATDCFAEAVTIARATDYPIGQVDALRGLGDIYRLRCRYEQAIGCFHQSLTIAHATGHQAGELAALTRLAFTHRLRGEHDPASAYFQRALVLARAAGNRVGELNALWGLADLRRLQGDHESAVDLFGQSLALARRTGNRIGELNGLYGLGNVRRLQGHHAPAIELLSQSLALARASDHRNGQFEALLGLGHTYHAAGQPSTALDHHQQALAIANALGQADDQARAHDGLAKAHEALGRHHKARDHWQRALDLYIDLGTSEADEIRSQLART